MRRFFLTLAAAVVLSTAIPVATPAPTAAHGCTLTADRPQTLQSPTRVISAGHARCDQVGYFGVTLRLQHYSTTLGWYTWKSVFIERSDDDEFNGLVSYIGCHVGGWRLRMTVHVVSSTGHSHTSTINSLTHWSGC